MPPLQGEETSANIVFLVLVGDIFLDSTKLSLCDSNLREFVLMSGASSRSCVSPTSSTFVSVLFLPYTLHFLVRYEK